MRNNIILIGPMGVGKTTIGRQLAKKLGRQFYDSDDELKKHTGVDISVIFEIEGETGFRKRESHIIQVLLEKDNIVLSTGGGSILLHENREILTKNGLVIYLKSSPETLYERISHVKGRPLLKGENRLQKIKNLLQERKHYYEFLSDKTIDVDKLTIKKTVNKILKIIDENEDSHC